MAFLESTDTLVDDWVDVQEMPVRAKAEATKRQEDTEIMPSDAQLYACLNATVLKRLAIHSSPIFTTNVHSRQLYTTLLDALPQGMRKLYSCNTCRAFVRRYGGLALVDDSTGQLIPLLWHPTDSEFDAVFTSAVTAMAQQFKGGKVVTEFKVTKALQSKMQATSARGGFHHMYASVPDSRVRKEEPQGFARASTTELAKMLAEVIRKYRPATISRAAQMVEQDKLPHADNHKAAIRWLSDLIENDRLRKNGADKVRSICRQNLGYRYAASAFVGCISQLKNGVLSTLLDAIEANESWDTIEKAWKQKTDPIVYLRPQAAPKAGNVSASERLFTQLGITENDLKRRYMVLDDVPKEVLIWTSKPTPSTKFAGLFSSVKPRESAPWIKNDQSDLPLTRITFTKLLTTILPTATRVEYKLGARDTINFMITGFPNTKPLMHWHDDSNRGSWYVYQRPYPVEEHGQKPDAWNNISAIFPFPHLWDAAPMTTAFPLADETSEEWKFYHKKEGFRYMLMLDNIVDKNKGQLCLFPTFLKGEFHGARATIEAFSNKGEKEMVENAEGRGGYVGGILVRRSMGKSGKEGEKHLVRVTDGKGNRAVWQVDLFE